MDLTNVKLLCHCVKFQNSSSQLQSLRLTYLSPVGSDLRNTLRVALPQGTLGWLARAPQGLAETSMRRRFLGKGFIRTGKHDGP